MAKQERYGGIIDGLVDNILEKYGISEEMIKKISSVIDGVAQNVEVQQIGDETYITINLNKINFKFKK
jgi:hypothetical protein